MVQALDKMMVTRLKLFQQRTNKLPERILIYRDGVSEVVIRNTNDD
jgi:Piwi domain